MKTSVVCGVKGRLPYLRQAAPTWLGCPEVDEVVLVDWSSEPPLTYDDLPRDSRIKIARAVGQEHWVLSKCCNLGLLLASGEWVVRLDADDLVDSSFMRAHPPKRDAFYHVDPKKMLREEDAHLSGVVCATRELFFEVGGYNERLLTYGCDDDDLVARFRVEGVAAALPLEALPLDLSHVWHLPHTDEERVRHQVVETREEGPKSWTYGLGPTYRSMDHNRQEIAQRKWTKEDKIAMWKIVPAGKYLLCEEQG